MTKRQPETGCFRLAALAAAAAVLLLSALLLPWWWSWQSDREAAELLQARIARYQAVIRSRPEIEHALKRIQEEIREGNYFFPGGNPELAAADLQQRIKEVVTAAGGTLLSTQGLSGGQAGTGRIGIRVRMKGDLETLARVLLSLEKQHPLLLVENLSIRGNTSYRRRGRAVEAVPRRELDIRFRVTGPVQEKKS